MDSEEKFWLSLWGLLTTIAIIITLSITYYNCSYNSKVLKALEAGIPSKQVKLAFNDYTSEAEKVIYALKETE